MSATAITVTPQSVKNKNDRRKKMQEDEEFL
jgi:hypothetical protein